MEFWSTSIVYCLLHPETSEVKYVGFTRRSLPRRLEGHLSSNKNTPVGQWIHRLRSAGLLPEMVELENVGVTMFGREDKDAEKFWIQYLRAVGAELLNMVHNGHVYGKARRRRA